MTNLLGIFEKRRGRCPHCGHMAHFRPHTLVQLEPEWLQETINLRASSPDRLMVLPVSCQGCLSVSLIGVHYRRGRVASVSLMYPAKAIREVAPSVPGHVASLFKEASTAESAGAMRAAGVMYRAAAEAICVEQGATGSDLKKKIGSLKHVDSGIADHLDQARVLGNTSIHEGVEYSPAEVADVAELLLEDRKSVV